MRAFGFLLLVGMAGCAGSPPAAVVEPGAAPVAGALTLEKSPDSGQVDRVGPSDGALSPDGSNDLAFVAKVDGPVSAIFLVGVDEAGKPTGAFQADTLVGDTEVPAELGAKPGSGTSGLGVFEAGQALNSKDGALAAIAAGPHELTLYLAASPAVTAGTRLRIYVQRPDKSLVAGSTVTD